MIRLRCNQRDFPDVYATGRDILNLNYGQIFPRRRFRLTESGSRSFRLRLISRRILRRAFRPVRCLGCRVLCLASCVTARENSGSGRPAPRFIVLVWLFLCPLAWSGSPQQNDSVEQSTDGDAQQLWTDGRVNLDLQALREAIGSGRDAEALARFRRLTTADPRVLAARSDNRHFVPLYRILAEEFERLPAAIQTILRTTNAQAARLALENVVPTGRWNELIQVSQRFPGTDSAHLAHLIVAQLHFDRGHLTAASHWLHALQSCSLSAQVKPLVQQLKSRLLRDSSAVAAPLSNHSSQLTEASSPGPWQVRWRQRTQLGTARLRDIDAAQLQANATTDAGWNAQIRNSVIYRRTLRGLTAIDLQSGHINWSLRLRPNHLDYLSRNNERSLSHRGPNHVLPERLRQLLIHDGVLSRVCAGSHAVYFVNTSSFPAGTVMNRLRSVAAKPDARLVAVSRDAGRRIWSVGGPPVESDVSDRMADVWFAGVPLVDGEMLHCIVQIGNEIRLCTLRAATGERLDSTLLAFSDVSIELDPARQLVSATPVAADGLLLCCTSTGWLTAVDQLTRTVVWATRTGAGSSSEVRAVRMNRRAGGSQVSAEQSPDSIIRVLGRTVAVMPWNSAEIRFLDVVSGSLRNVALRQSRPGLLATDGDAVIIISRSDRIERVSASTAESVWVRELTSDDGRPCGPGTIVNGRLLLAMTTGAIVSIDVQTGDIQESAADVLRPSRHGLLLSATTGTPETHSGHQGDLVFVGPDETVCLTRDSVSATPEQITDLVELLLASGRVQAAQDALRQLSVETIAADERASSLQFEVAFALAVAAKLSPETSLESLARTRQHQVRAAVLGISRQGQNDPVAAANAAIDLFQREERSESAFTADSIKIPVGLLPTAIMTERSSVTDFQYSKVSLQTWTARTIEHALNYAPSAAGVLLVRRCRVLSPDTLLQINHLSVAETISTLLSDAGPSEQTSLLRLHRNAILRANGESPILLSSEWPPNGNHSLISSGDTARRQYSRLLQEIAESGEALGISGAEQNTSAAFHKNGFRDWADSWNRDDYQVIPFARPNPVRRRPYRLKFTDPNDPFLGRFDLLIHRAPSRLIVREIAPPGRLIWSIPGEFPERPGSTSVPLVERSGTLLYILSPNAVTAVSLLEQRVLWQARADLHRITGGRDSVGQKGPRLISSGSGWVCLQTGQSVELRSSLTGQVRWSRPCTPSSTVFAGDACVIMGDTDSSIDPVAALDRRSGQRLNCQLSVKDLGNITGTDGNEFIIRESSPENHSSVQLVWRDALTGETSRTVNVVDVVRVRHDRSSQLDVFHNDGRLTVIDLPSGSMREYLWSNNTVSAENRPTGDDGADRSHEWHPDRIRVFEDSVYLYLILQPKNSPPGGQVPERELTPFLAMRVLDRDSGEFLWENTQAKSCHGRVVTDQLSLPFLVLLDHSAPNKRGGRAVQVRLRCLRKRDGRRLIDQQLPARYAYDQLRISPSQDYSVTVRVHGTLVRFELPDSPSVRSPTGKTHELDGTR